MPSFNPRTLKLFFHWVLSKFSTNNFKPSKSAFNSATSSSIFNYHFYFIYLFLWKELSVLVMTILLLIVPQYYQNFPSLLDNLASNALKSHFNSFKSDPIFCRLSSKNPLRSVIETSSVTVCCSLKSGLLHCVCKNLLSVLSARCLFLGLGILSNTHPPQKIRKRISTPPPLFPASLKGNARGCYPLCIALSAMPMLCASGTAFGSLRALNNCSCCPPISFFYPPGPCLFPFQVAASLQSAGGFTLKPCRDS